MIGTIKKVADVLGYQLGHNREETVHRDLDGNVQRRISSVSHGFTSRSEERDGLDNVTHRSSTFNGIPGLFGGRRKTRVSEGLSHEQEMAQRLLRRPSSGPTQGPFPPAPGPVPPTTPNAPTSPTTPNGPTAPTNPLRPPMPFTPNPHGLRPNGVMNSRMWPGEPPQAPSPFQHTPQPLDLTQPLPFNGSPQGRSDYGNPFGTP